jgi:hypothetical protein
MVITKSSSELKRDTEEIKENKTKILTKKILLKFVDNLTKVFVKNNFIFQEYSIKIETFRDTEINISTKLHPYRKLVH